MKTIDLPLQDVEIESVFIECINGYRSTSTVNELLAYATFVAKDSVKYTELIPHSLKSFHPAKTPPETAKKLSGLYTDKFAKNGSPGRPYYEEIIAGAPNGICPLCGIGEASTLDHYLPKSAYPTLSITPANLIPACFDCNHKKGSASKSSTLPIHAYLDEIPHGRWLYANFSSSFTIDYYVLCPSSWNYDLQIRINNHFNVYGLRKKYAAHASELLAEKKPFWKKALAALGADQLPQLMRDELDGFRNVDENSWKSALLECLILSENTNAWLISDS